MAPVVLNVSLLILLKVRIYYLQMSCNIETVPLTTGRELSFKPHNFEMLFRECSLKRWWFRETPTCWTDGTCDHSWLTMLSGNAPLTSGKQRVARGRFNQFCSPAGLFRTCQTLSLQGIKANQGPINISWRHYWDRELRDPRLSDVSTQN